MRLSRWMPAALMEWLSAERSYGDFASYEEALEAAGGLGYNDPACLAERFDETLSVVYAPLLAALRSSRDGLRVIDLGGGFGKHYRQAKAFGAWPLRWIVVERSALVQSAMRLDCEYATTLCEASAMLGGNRPTLVMASGALQYMPQPCQTLDALCDLGADWFLLLRTPLRHAARIIVQQSLTRIRQRVRYPAMLLDRDNVIGAIRKGYRIEAIFDEGVGYRLGAEHVHNFSILASRLSHAT